MRLTCPNCGAQYEVPDEVIPETGRDVQCSNCGDTWFQHHPDHQPAEDDEPDDAPHPGWDSPDEEPEPDAVEEPQEDISDRDQAPDQEEASEPEIEVGADIDIGAAPDQSSEDADEPDAVAEHGEEGETPEEPAQAAADDEPDVNDEPETEEGPARRGLDPSIADVLREEAAREQEARAGETGGDLETQPDLGLDGMPDEEGQRSQESRERMARLRGLPEEGRDDEEPEPDPGLISRRNLLPDIDEINSSLDSESTRVETDYTSGDAGVAEAAAARKGFNRGFLRVVLLVAVLVLVYVLAPMISEKVPALSGVLSGYVDAVNAGRLWLNDMIGITPAQG